MTAVELLQQKFNAIVDERIASQEQYVTRYTVTDWMNETGIALSLQTCTSVLLRGQSKGFIGLMSLAIALNCTKEELIFVAKECGDTYLYRYFVADVLTPDTSQLLADYKLLNGEQKELIKATIKQMIPKKRGDK